MKDIQNSPADIAMPINRVGIRGIHMPLLVRQKNPSDHDGMQCTVASIDLGVDLPAAFKGTHMSRFIESLQHWAEHSDALDYSAMRELLLDIRRRLDARRAHVVFHFPYFINRPAPSSGRTAPMQYHCILTGDFDEKAAEPVFTLDVTVPVMTVCPCSKAISDEGAHSQRADVHVRVRMAGRLWIEDLIDISESAGSSPVYTLLKREDEKFVTEHAFANPMFVEDVVRAVAAQLERHPQVCEYEVEVESHESIHAHNAFARIEGGRHCSAGHEATNTDRCNPIA